MSIIEQIRSEVERMKNDSVHLHTYDELLSFLDTLQEQPVCEELEEEIESFKEKIGFPVYWCDEKEQMDWLSIIARHFYELGCRRTAEKYDEIEYKRQRAGVCEELEEAAKQHSCYEEDCENTFYEPIVRNAFKAGATWQKEQMMKEAVEGKVYAVFPSNQVLCGAVTSTLKYGDKVRIVIVKEDEK